MKNSKNFEFFCKWLVAIKIFGLTCSNRKKVIEQEISFGYSYNNTKFSCYYGVIFSCASCS